MMPADLKRSAWFADRRRFRQSATALGIVLLLVAGSLVPNVGPTLVFKRPPEPQTVLDSWLFQKEEVIRRLQQELRAEQKARRPFITKARSKRLQDELNASAREGDLAH
jgi:hypothetical protein